VILSASAISRFIVPCFDVTSTHGFRSGMEAMLFSDSMKESSRKRVDGMLDVILGRLECFATAQAPVICP
jgi:hypothetical protein